MNNRRYVVAGAVAASALGLGLGAMFPRPRQQAAVPGPARRANAGIPDVELQAHDGTRVRFYQDLVRDKLVVINMMYAGCNVTCPPMTYNLAMVQQLLGDRVGRDIFMYSITLRPQQDAPADLADFARRHGVAPGWLFLTGKPADVEQLRYALGFYDPDPLVDRQEGRHVGMVRIGNESMRRWSMVPALAHPRHMVAAILRMDRSNPGRPS